MAERSPTEMRRSDRLSIWAAGLSLLLVAAWTVAKVVLFEHLEYTSDLFQHLTLSRSAFQGLGVLWEPQYGGLTHNYPLLLALYPLTAPLGAHGLFVAWALLTAAAIVAVSRLTRLAEAWPRARCWTVVGTMMLGPAGFWMWDDPIYGWHTELLFLPLAVLFAVGLLRGSAWAWIAAAALVLNREEGAIIAGAIHVLVLAGRLEPGANAPAHAASDSVPFGRLARVALAYAVIFGVNMAVLLARQPSLGESRVGLALGHLPVIWAADAAARAEIWTTIGDAAWLLLGCAPLLVTGLRASRVAWAAALSLPLWITGLVGVLAHQTGGAMAYHGLGWPPRLVMLWSVLTVGGLVAAWTSRTPMPRRRSVGVLLCVGACLAAWAVQGQALDLRRSYDVVDRWDTVVRGRHRLVAAGLTLREESMLRCLGQRLPANTTVKCPAFLNARFHRQRYMADPRTATVVVIDDARVLRWPITPRPVERAAIGVATEHVQIDQLWLAFSPGLRSTVAPCLARQ